jgi:secreted PhoX family phosphatase
MLCTKGGRAIADLSEATRVGTTDEVTWVDGPDNICLDPNGGLILTEDGDGIQHLVGVTTAGTSFPMARNEASGSEFAGPTFSRDGRAAPRAVVRGQGDGVELC